MTEHSDEHGGARNYQRGCRCAECREGWRVYKSALRRRHGVPPRAQWLEAARAAGRHGVRSRYIKGCRCAQCRAAEARYRKAYRARKVA